jgi:hypothetical protein
MCREREASRGGGPGSSGPKIYKIVEGKRVTVKYHSGKVPHSNILKSISRDADLTLEEFVDLMK